MTKKLEGWELHDALYREDCKFYHYGIHCENQDAEGYLICDKKLLVFTAYPEIGLLGADDHCPLNCKGFESK